MGQTITTHIRTNRKTSSRKGDMHDFLLLYSPTVGDSNLFGTLHALYYLPENYKLIVLVNDSLRDQVAKVWAAGSIMMDRISFENRTGLSHETSPFSFAGAVISDSSDAVVISKDESESSSHGILAVPKGNPEALASAVLKLSKGRLAPSEIQQYA